MNYGFELDPLDLSLAEVQMKLRKRLAAEMPEEGSFTPIVEEFEMHDPTRSISRIRIDCEPAEGDMQERRLVMMVWDEEKDESPVSYLLAKGSSSEILSFLHSGEYLQTCKEYIIGSEEDYDDEAEGSFWDTDDESLIEEDSEEELSIEEEPEEEIPTEVDQRPLVCSDDGDDVEGCVRGMISELWEKVKAEVPEEGDFKMVYVRMSNPDRSIVITDFLLRIDQPPVGIEGREKTRCLTFVGYKLPSPYICDKLIEVGTKQEILDYLGSEKCINRLLEMIPIFEDCLSRS